MQRGMLFAASDKNDVDTTTIEPIGHTTQNTRK